MGFLSRSMVSYCVPALLMLLLLAVVACSCRVDGTRDYDADAWSEDIQITRDEDWVYDSKEVLCPQLMSNGNLRVVYAKTTEEDAIRFTSVECDKQGRSATSSKDIEGPATYLSGGQMHALALHYDEADEAIRAIGMGWRINTELWLSSYNMASGTEEDVFTLAEALPGMNLSNTFFWCGIDSCWDELGRAHVTGFIFKEYDENDDPTFDIWTFYMMVSWKPIRVHFTAVWASERLPWYQIGFISMSRIALSEDGRPAIFHTIQKANINYRALSVRDQGGNWSTHVIWRVASTPSHEIVPMNGLMVDRDMTVHMAWIGDDRSLFYMNCTMNGTLCGVPIKVVTVPDVTWIEFTLIEMGMTIDGDLLFAYNANMASSRRTDIHDTPGQIDLLLIPGGDFSVVNRTVIPLVEVGTASYCRLFMDPNDNVFLFWFDRRTGYTHLYLKHCVHPDLTIEVDPSDWAMARLIRPNETKVIPLRVRNIGTMELTASLGVESNASQGWNLHLDRDRAFVDVAQCIHLNLTVHCPTDAGLGTAVEIYVTASASDQETEARLRLVMIVHWKRVLNAQCQPSYNIVDPGGSAIYSVHLVNHGDLPEGIDISIHGVGPLGWQYEPAEVDTCLFPGRTEELEVLVTAPADARADAVFVVVVEFAWDEGGFAHPPLHLRTTVNPTFFVTLELNRTEAILLPGEHAAFCITVGNVGNLVGIAYVEVEVLTDSRDWEMTLSTATVILEAGHEEEIILVLAAPMDAVFGEILVVKVRAFSSDPPSEAMGEVRVEVGAVHKLEWSHTGLEWQLDPLENVTGDLTFSNEGNTVECITLLIYEPESGIGLHFEEGGIEIGEIEVGPGEQRRVTLSIQAMANASAGLHRLRLHIEVSGATAGFLDLKVTVGHISILSVRVHGQRNDTLAGGTIELRVDLSNLGNGHETVTLDASGTWLEGHRFILEHVNVTSVWVPRGRTISYLLWVRISPDTPVGEHTLEVVARSTSDTSSIARALGTFNIHLPSLQVVEVEVVPGLVEAGELTTVRLLLRNTGLLEVSGVVVVMDGVGEEAISSIAPGAEATAIFTWIAGEAGHHELHGTVRYGPGEHVIDWSYEVDVGSVGAGRSYDSWMLLTLLLAISAVAILALRSRMQDS